MQDHEQEKEMFIFQFANVFAVFAHQLVSFGPIGWL